MILYCHVTLGDVEKQSLLSALQPGDQCTFADDVPQASQQVRCQEAEVIFGNVPADWLAHSPQLRWLQLSSAGLNAYTDLDWQCCSDVIVTNLRDFYGQSCAETALGGILALYRGIAPLLDYQRKNEWIGSKIRPSLQLLARKQALVLGAGAIGATLGQLLRAFGCQVTYIRRSQAPTFANLDSLLPEADLVIGTLPETPETKQLMNAARIALMKTGSLLVNVGRGSLIDETALLAALSNGKLAGAVLDVTDEEPLPADSPLWQLPNVILTQHTSGGYADEKQDMTNVFISNLRCYQAQKPLAYVVDLRKGY